MTVSLQIIYLFMLVTSRVSGLVTLGPVFSSMMVNAKVRIALVLSISAVLTASLPPQKEINPSMMSMGFAMAGEFATGLLLAGGFRLAMTSASIAGELAGLQMGLGSASLFDPHTAANSSVLPNFFVQAFTVLFIALDGHHHMLRILSESLTVLSPNAKMTLPSIEFLLRQTAEMLAYGCRLAAPVVIPLLLITIAVGMVSRVFPQANVMSLSYAVSMTVGLLLLAVMMTGIDGAVWHLIQDADRFALRNLQALAGN